MTILNSPFSIFNSPPLVKNAYLFRREAAAASLRKGRAFQPTPYVSRPAGAAEVPPPSVCGLPKVTRLISINDDFPFPSSGRSPPSVSVVRYALVAGRSANPGCNDERGLLFPQRRCRHKRGQQQQKRKKNIFYWKSGILFVLKKGGGQYAILRFVAGACLISYRIHNLKMQKHCNSQFTVHTNAKHKSAKTLQETRD